MSQAVHTMSFMDLTLGALPLDLVLLGIITWQTISGARRGLARVALRLAGMVVGGFAAWLAIPWVVTLGGNGATRIAMVMIVGLGLVVVGGSIGGAIGRSIGGVLERVRLGAVNRLLGAVAGLLASSLMIGLVSSAVSGIGAPWLTQTLSSSRVVTVIDGLMPSSLRSTATLWGQSAIDEGLPWVVEALGGVSQEPSLPQVDLATPQLTQAAKSVVRISGPAYACGQEQTGSGFVVSDDRVVTNAHVVSGVSEPVVEVPGKPAKSGRITYFDPKADLAVIDVDGLGAPVLPLASAAAVGRGTQGAVQGYPGGGPFTSGPASVMAAGTVDFSGSGPRDVLTLAANVQPGNSGGPLITTNGEIAGVVFAKERSVPNVGYAIPLSDLKPVVQKAPGLTATVSSGSCTTD
ncbi:MarP family serine protease [Pseudoclavibacter sp. CFCC 11306]|nr:MarP family serine protease [Pseudoclavibacter sp. CFCC 11306]